jgi:hypothetical protein
VTLPERAPRRAGAVRSLPFLIFIGILLLLGGDAVSAPRAPDAPRRIEVHATPIRAFSMGDETRTRFGALEFRGGLELTSSYREFGGLSSLRLSPDGQDFLTLSDKAHWFRGRIAYEKDRPVGLVDVEAAPALGPDGKPLAKRGWYDTESIAQDGGTLWVGIERVNRIVRFDYGRDGLLARGMPIEVPPGVKRLPNNKGLEALVFLPKGGPLGGTLVALSERGLDAAGNLTAFLIGGPTPGTFTVRRIDDYDISDATLLPSGDVLILERRFTWLTGVAMRIRKLAVADIKPGAVVDGAVLIEADMRYQIDNMEGLAVHRGTAGETVLTMVSDDNFSPIQRTILLQFTLVE